MFDFMVLEKLAISASGVHNLKMARGRPDYRVLGKCQQ